MLCRDGDKGSDRFMLATPTGYAALLVPSFTLSVLRCVKPYSSSLLKPSSNP